MSLITQACIKEQMSVPDGIPTHDFPNAGGVGEGGRSLSILFRAQGSM